MGKLEGEDAGEHVDADVNSAFWTVADAADLDLTADHDGGSARSPVVRKRRLSDVIFAQLQADTRRAAAGAR